MNDTTTTRFRFHHVAISAYNMAESVAFYEGFGFRVATCYAEPNGAFEIAHLKLDNAYLEIWCYENPNPPPESAADLASDLQRIGVKHVALQVPSVHAARRWADEQKIPVHIELTQGRTGVKYFFVKDPSGNFVEILEDNRNFNHVASQTR